MSLAALVPMVDRTAVVRRFGRVAAVQGLTVEIVGVPLGVGARVAIPTLFNTQVQAEVVGFRDGRAVGLPFSSVDGIVPGAKAEVLAEIAAVRPTRHWLGRVINAFGEPIDGRGALPEGAHEHPLRTAPPPAHRRRRVGARIDVGVRALNAFTTVCRGQRLGIFAGSGVGKSVLLSMLARYTACDVAVIGLIGERGREVQEFLSEDLGP